MEKLAEKRTRTRTERVVEKMSDSKTEAVSRNDIRLERLRLFEDEIANIAEWIREEFAGKLHERAYKQLQTAKRGLERLEETISK